MSSCEIGAFPTHFLPEPDDLRGAAREALRLHASQEHECFFTATSVVIKKGQQTDSKDVRRICKVNCNDISQPVDRLLMVALQTSHLSKPSAPAVATWQKWIQ